MRRLAALVLTTLVLPVATAQAWTWPVNGPILRGFSFDHAHPYLGGQHRGLDLGAAGGSPVLAPADGVVSFAGTVPEGGRTVSIQTPSGYTATLLHLGSTAVTRGAAIREGAVVGTVGPSGVVAHAEPYVYFGVRTTSDAQGYVDPLTLLPSRPVPVAPPEQTAVAVAAAPAAAPDVSQAAAPADLPVSLVPASAALPPASASAPAVATEPGGSAVAHPAGEPFVVESRRIALDQTARSSERRRRARPAAEGVAPRHRSLRSLSQTRRSATGDRVSWVPRPEPDAAGIVTTTTNGRAGGEHQLRLPLAFAVLMLCALLAVATRTRSRRRAARIMSLPEPEQFGVRAIATEEDLGRTGVAVCIGQEAFGSRGGLRRAGRHLRAVPPLEGQRRPDGERDGRARDAGDGHRRSRGRLAA